MERIELPEDISALTEEELATLTEQIATAAAGTADLDDSDESVTYVESLADANDAVKAEQSRRTAAAAERAGRRDAAAARLQAVDPDEGEDGDDDGDAIDDELAEITESETAVVASAPKTIVRPSSAKSLSARRPSAVAPKAVTEERHAFMRSTVHAHVGEDKPFYDPLDVAKAIVKKRNTFTHIGPGVHDEIPIAIGIKEFDHNVTPDELKNYGTISEVLREAPALVASGVACAPIAPSYEFYRLAEPQNPVEQATPVVGTPRGGLRFIVPAAVTQAANAVDYSLQSRDYTGSTVLNTSGPKSCITVSCPSLLEEDVAALSTCVTFDNLRYRVFPELVAAFLEDVAVNFASRKEVLYLDYINSKSTQVTGDFGYGVARSIIGDWTQAAVGFRKRQGMKRGAPITILAPDWALDEVKLDMLIGHEQELAFWQITDAQVDSFLSERGLKVVWYNDNPTGVTPNQKLITPQTAGALLQFPTKIRSFIYAPGSFVRLDGGTLDVGLVRDSVLNGTNNLQLFMEEWLGMAFLGFESISLTSTAKLNGVGPAGVAARL